MAKVTRKQFLERLAQRAKLQKRAGVVIQYRDLVDFLALLTAAEGYRDDPSSLEIAVSCFEHLVEAS